VIGTATVAQAHGRPPSLNQVIFDPAAPERIVAQATWGAVLSEDGGATWRWLCADAMGVRPRNQDPRMAIVADGHLVVGTFDGLVRSDPSLCGYERPDEALAEDFVIDVAAVPGRPDEVYALRTNSLAADQLFLSRDRGATFAAIGPSVETTLLDRVLVGVDDPARVYLSGAMPRGVSEDNEGFVLASTDGGDSFATHRFPFEGEEWNALLLVVDPTDADRILVDIVHFDGEEVPERVALSEDGGETWATATRIAQVGGAAFSDDGAVVLVGSRLGGLSRSDDGGRSFRVVDPDLSVRCIARRGDEVWVCTDPSETRVGLLRSTDGGETFEPALHFDQIAELPECPRCSDVGVVCPAWFPDVAYDLGLDASIPDGAIDPDAGTGQPREIEIPPECVGDGGDAGAGDDAKVSDAGADTNGFTARGGGASCGVAGGAGGAAGAWMMMMMLFVAVRARRR